MRFKIQDNGHLQIRGIKKTDEGMYNCEARVLARGEIDFKMIKVVVNGKHYISVKPPLRACILLLDQEEMLLDSGDPENLGNVLFKPYIANGLFTPRTITTMITMNI